MKNLDAFVMRYFGFIAAGVSFALLLAAHSFELFGGLQPCAMCMNQRAIHWAAVGAGLVIGLAGRPRVRLIGLWILAAVYLFSTLMAGYHVAIEHHWVGDPRCSVGRAGWPFDPALSWVMEHIAGLFGFHKQTLAERMMALMNGTATPAPACDKPAWWFLSLTMAAWNTLISLLMTILSVRAATWKGTRA